MTEKTLQETKVGDPVTFDTVVATTVSFKVPAKIHNNEEFLVEVMVKS